VRLAHGGQWRMVGDGSTMPCLLAAAVSHRGGERRQIARTQPSLVILGDRPRSVSRPVALARDNWAKVRQKLAWRSVINW